MKKISITTSHPLNDDEKEQIIKKFKSKFKNEELEFEFNIDKSIIGGIVITINDTLYDFSIKNKLNLIKKTLLQS